MLEKNPVTLGLIGAGRWGRNFLETTRSLPNIKLKYVCVKTETTLKSLPDEYTKTTNYEDFFKFSEIDGVIIATPASTHYEIAKSFLKKEYNLFIEKPVTATLDQALALQKLHRQKKSVILVGHIQVYNPVYMKLKEESQSIGLIQELAYTGLQSQPRTDVSVLEDWGPHPISIFLDFTQTSPNSISARYTSIDNIHLELEFPNNVVAKADIGWTAPRRARKLAVVGTNGSLAIDTGSPTQGSTPLAEEIKEFARCIRNGQQPKTNLAQAVKVMQILELAQKSLNAGGKLLKVKMV